MSDMIDMDASGWNSAMFEDNDTGYKLLFLLFDCSGSVSGTILGSIKNIMEEISTEHENSGIKVMVAQLSKKVNWMNDMPIDLNLFNDWRKITSGGCLNLGKCFEDILFKISEKGMIEYENNAENISFMLVSDGMSVDQYEMGLKRLKSNSIFAKAKKYAINMTDLTWALQSELQKHKVLSDFTDDMSFVIDSSSMNSEEIELIFEKIIFE